MRGLHVGVLMVAAGSSSVLGLSRWRTLVPGPTDFAGGANVALADYTGASPTGVPAELAAAESL